MSEADLTAIQAITPYSVLCPSTPFFLFSLITFFLGILTLALLHKDDLFVSTGWIGLFAITVTGIDWRHILVSLQIFLPMNIWAVNFANIIVHWFARTCFPGWYARIAESMRLAEEERQRRAEEERLKNLAETEGRVDVEAEAGGEAQMEGDAHEETPLNGGIRYGMPSAGLSRTNRSEIIGGLGGETPSDAGVRYGIPSESLPRTNEPVE